MTSSPEPVAIGETSLPEVEIPADQAWFWAAAWQEREAEVDAHVLAGETTCLESVEALMGHLADLDDAE